MINYNILQDIIKRLPAFVSAYSNNTFDEIVEMMNNINFQEAEFGGHNYISVFLGYGFLKLVLNFEASGNFHSCMRYNYEMGWELISPHD